MVHRDGVLQGVERLHHHGAGAVPFMKTLLGIMPTLIFAPSKLLNFNECEKGHVQSGRVDACTLGFLA